MGPYRFCSGGTLYKPSWGYRFGYRFRVGPYRFCSNGNPTTLSILLWSYLILSDTHMLISLLFWGWGSLTPKKREDMQDFMTNMEDGKWLKTIFPSELGPRNRWPCGPPIFPNPTYTGHLAVIMKGWTDISSIEPQPKGVPFLKLTILSWFLGSHPIRFPMKKDWSLLDSRHSFRNIWSIWPSHSCHAKMPRHGKFHLLTVVYLRSQLLDAEIIRTKNWDTEIYSIYID